ncbi:MAG: flavin reductase family protein [Clostridia bacterium]|nr:flavin reductase family protein [Clostridia bacterium]
MNKTTFKGGAMLSPVPPTLVSCGDENQQNIFTVAWTGTMCTDPPITYISVRPSRHSYEIIRRTGQFVINLVPASLVKVCDICGVKSGRDIDKFAEFKLTALNATRVSAPLISQCPVNIECKVINETPLGTHNVFMAEILAVNVDSNLIDKNGKICLWKADLLAYAHGSYYTLGKYLGDFGFSVKKKNKHKKK